MLRRNRNHNPSDEELRRLARRAKEGDPEAQLRVSRSIERGAPLEQPVPLQPRERRCFACKWAWFDRGSCLASCPMCGSKSVTVPQRKRNPGDDEDMRSLERKASQGDRDARLRLRRARLRKGIPDPLWKGALELSSYAQFMAEHENYLEDFIQGYGDCVFWSEGEFANPDDPEQFTFESMGLTFPEHVDPRTLARMRRDSLRFVRANWRDLHESGLRPSRAGFDFNLARQGHGTGFFDEGTDPVFERIQEAAEEFGEIHFYFTGDVQEQLDLEGSEAAGVVSST